MGLPFRIVLYATNHASAHQVSEAAFGRIAELNAIMSDYEENSELSRLSRTSGTGQAIPVSPDLWRVLERGQKISSESDGAFDVTVGPLVQVWKRARRQRELPEPARLQAALEASGWKKLELDSQRRTARLLVSQMKLDLGGIAKGYALDEAASVIKRSGISRYLVSGGGDMAVGDAPPGAKGWKVEIGLIDATNAPAACFVWLHNAALATSGDTFQRAEINGVRYSHIVNPHTGYGLTNHSVVTVIGPNVFIADPLTKAMSILDPVEGIALARKYRCDVSQLRLPADKVEVFRSPGMEKWCGQVGAPN
ncbi:MAG TPA: FAD:protein FMN transferase [Candidatus Limnocylindria bacterium]|jgi:thiamine biosynthesis lipoprotein|nr:FAD:protein FMN transferase [Candidatus Limnocylindria bacterium]